MSSSPFQSSSGPQSARGLRNELMCSRPVCQALSPASIAIPWLTNHARMAFLVLLIRPSRVLRYLTSDRNSRCSGDGVWTGFEFAHGGHASEFESVVSVGFPFDVGPPPGFFVGGADECFESARFCQIVDPSRGAAGLHDDEVGFAVLEDAGEVFSRGGCGEKLRFASFGVEEAANGVEFAEVQCENLHVDFSPCVWWVE